MKVYAHRGASATHPENTLEAFAEAIRLGADGIELDVHVTADGVPVVIHDRSLARSVSADVNLDDIGFPELRELVPSIPTLPEVLTLIGAACHLDIEIKHAGSERIVLDTLADHPGCRWAISSFDWEVIAKIRELNDDAETWLLGLTWSQSMLDTAKATGPHVVALNDKTLNRATVEEIHKSGLGVMVWTVNDPDRAETLRTWGVDALCTDNPAAMLTAQLG